MLAGEAREHLFVILSGTATLFRTGPTPAAVRDREREGERGREREREGESERARERARESERARERESVCVCV